MSSTLTHESPEVGQAELTGRNVHRARGWRIAVIASLTLWAGIGAAVWGVLSTLD